MAQRKMHQTTVRFGADLWEALDEECSRLGVSAAQFVREATLARLMYAAGQRGDEDFDHALEVSGAPSEEIDAGELDEPGEAKEGGIAGTLERSAAEFSESAALWAQGAQARRRARELREIAKRRRPHA
jgi:hypothetical protein